MPDSRKAENTKEDSPPSRILLVEDNDSDMHLLEKALQARGIAYELIRYEDGEEAMRFMASNRTLTPDLILLDLNLPRREGFDVLRAVRTMPRLVGVPVGVFTSSNAARDRRRTALIGADKYIYKPVVLGEFIEEVGKAIEELLSLCRDRETATPKNA